MRSTRAWAAVILLCASAWGADFGNTPVGRMPFGAHTSSNPAASTVALDAESDVNGFLNFAESTDPILGAIVCASGRVGTPPTYKVSLQGLGASGIEDGTIKGGGSPVSKTFTPPADTSWNNTVQRIAFDNPYTPTLGEALAVVTKHDSGTVDGSNHFILIGEWSNVVTRLNVPYHTVNGAKQQGYGLPCGGWYTANRDYGFPIASITYQTFHANSTPDEYRLTFQKPCSVTGNTFKIGRFGWAGAVSVTGSSLYLKLYQGGSALITDTYDADHFQDTDREETSIPFKSQPTLSCGTTYDIGISTDSTSLALAMFILDTDGTTSAFPGGANWKLSTCTDGGSCSSDGEKRPVAWITLIDDTAPAGGSGGTRSYAVGN